MKKLQKCLRFVFFAVNFSVSVFLAATCVVGIVVADNPFSFMGGLMLLGPSGLYSLLEWFAYYRGRRSLERPLGVLNLCGAGFLLFGLITNIGEAFTYDEPPSMALLASFTAIFLSLIAYLAASGWFRLRYAVSK